MAIRSCSKCLTIFECTAETKNCWCEDLYLDLEILKKLKDEYDSCLCRACLKEYSDSLEK